MAVDTVFNEQMRPAFVGEPAEVKRRLKAGHPEGWTKVCVGETGLILTVPEYLYEVKYAEVREMLKELLRKQNLPMYKRDPERLEIYLDSAARKIIEKVLGD